MNSYGGFVSHYRDCFAQERRYIIKGGPGCGKSTLMRRIAHEAEQRGLEVEYYDCSSDPGSLDGIVLPSLDIAMFDGTAPHEEAADAPGWRDNLIDLGAYWDSKILRDHQDEIILLSEKKTEAYRGAYRYLGMAGTASLLRLELLKIMYLVIPFALDAIITFILSRLKVEEANEQLRSVINN